MQDFFHQQYLILYRPIHGTWAYFSGSGVTGTSLNDPQKSQIVSCVFVFMYAPCLWMIDKPCELLKDYSLKQEETESQNHWWRVNTFPSLGWASQNQCNSSCHETCQHQPIHFQIASYASKHALSLTCESISWSFLTHTRCNIPHLWVLTRFLKPPSHWFPSVAIRLQKANRRDHQADQTPCSCWDWKTANQKELDLWWGIFLGMCWLVRGHFNTVCNMCIYTVHNIV